MHNLLQAVEWPNQKFVGPGLQVCGLATPRGSVLIKVFLPQSQYPADFTLVSFQSELWTTVPRTEEHNTRNNHKCAKSYLYVEEVNESTRGDSLPRRRF